MEDEAESEGLVHIGHAAWRVLADVCRLRKNSVPRVEGEKGPEVFAQEEMRGLRASTVRTGGSGRE